MKRVGFLYEKIISRENCVLAIKEALKNKMGKRGVQEILDNVEEYASKISEDPFCADDYRPKTVRDRASGKTRDLLIPSPLDLCRQHQLIRVVNPIFERSFYEHSYACRKGYGTMKCASYVKRKVRSFRKRKTYFAKLDIVRFYDSIDHEAMKVAFLYYKAMRH